MDDQNNFSSNDFPSNGDWIRYKELVFFQLKGLTDLTKEMDAKIDAVRNDILILKIKAWAFGIIGGGIVTALFQIAIAFYKK